ncbi:hypothetical protein ACIO8G_37510 [Streptomyces sp. NPDC087219]|uniref:hypothetical protein n=1 Tax=Streptomyces sp. NPDC087219 TaxID=3365770 RepID=UPI0037F61141
MGAGAAVLVVLAALGTRATASWSPLVARYVLLPGQLTHLRRTNLDRSKGRLRLCRPGRMDHVVYLNAFTLRLATAWELQRHRLAR